MSMRIQGVNGNGLSAALSANALRAPAPHSRTTEANTDPVSVERQGTAPSEEQVPRAAPSAESPALPRYSHPRLRRDEESGRIVAAIIGRDGQVIKEIPPEELRELAARVRQLRGLLFDEQA